MDGIRGSIIIGKFMLAFRRIDFTGKSVSTEWGNIYRSAINAQNINIAPSAGPDFSSKPYVTVSLDITSGTCWLGMYGNGGVHKVGSNLRWGFSNNELQLLRATSGNVSGSVIILALGEIA
ncbi:hypothetical protein IJG22_02435 [Candidatus Saccharibacteria bacterium]|nr:hypothetical protein [Candidatus Saccharibacteria bacterium]